jgi:hypothetical protein
LRQQQDAERFHGRHGEEEHHRRAVYCKELIVEVLADQRIVTDRQLRAHDQR